MDGETIMTQRLNVFALSPDGYMAKVGINTHLLQSGLDHTLLHLVRMRVSQINACANCLHMHREEALKDGETEKRLLLLNAWKESALFTQREKAALQWAESLTHIDRTGAPDADYDVVRAEFSDKEIADLTLAIAEINGWNRIAVAMRIANPQDKSR
jgi:AhpD family alkylhydroperoxidase